MSVRDAFVLAAKRAVRVGFEIVEIHTAHGYLLHSHLSPLSNFRPDAYGGTLEGRMKFPLEVAAAVRAALPAGTPVFVRIASTDGIDGGWEMDDSVVFARELKRIGIDVVDCSSGGNSPRGATNADLPRAPGYQAPSAARIRHEVGIQTMAVGLIREPERSEKLLQHGSADLIAIGRQFLYDPSWALHAGGYRP